MNYNQVLQAGAIRHAESRFPLGPEGDSSHSVTGELFKTHTHQGLKVEGELYSVGFSSPAAAVDAWKREFDLLYPPDLRATLYWRLKPLLEWDTSGWRVYSRLLVSAQPRERAFS